MPRTRPIKNAAVVVEHPPADQRPVSVPDELPQSKPTEASGHQRAAPRDEAGRARRRRRASIGPSTYPPQPERHGEMTASKHGHKPSVVDS